MTSPERSRASWVVVIITLVLALFVLCLVNGLAWIDRPFAGFLVLRNGVVVSLARADWMPGRHLSTAWTRVIAVDGRPVAGGPEVHSYVQAKGSGRAVTYTFRRGTDMFRLALDVRPFGWKDFLEMFVPLFGVGLVMVLTGGAVVRRRPHAPEAQALFAICLSLGCMLITGPDQYFPYRFGAVFFLSLAAVPAAILHFVLTYPQLSSLFRFGRRFYAVVYLPFAGVGLGLLASASQPALFLPLLYALYFCIANAVLLGVGSVLLAMIQGARPLAPLVLVLATVLGSSVPIAILVSYPLLERTISPAFLVTPLLLIPAFLGTALTRFPRPHDPKQELAL